MYQKIIKILITYINQYTKMFPTYMDQKHDIYFQEKHRRRARNDPHNRDYICPCGKSYLSYPALFTHIKQKHNGRAPGQIIKPKSENSGKRGRPRTKQVYDSESDTEDDAGNVIDNLCDYVTDIQRKAPSELKKIYTSSDFYLIYANHKEGQPKYNQQQDLYQDTCDHVFCQFLIQINKRELDPSLFDQLFVFVMLLTKALNQHFYVENQKAEFIKRETAKDIVDIVNIFILDYFPKFVEQYNLQQKEFFQTKHTIRILEYLFTWMLMKKYSGHKIRRNEDFKAQ